YLFVQHASGDELHHFKLTRGKEIKQTSGVLPARGRLALLARTGEGPLDAVQEFVSLKRFGKEIDRPCLHHPGAHWDVAVTSDKDKLLFAPALDQGLLEFKAI